MSWLRIDDGFEDNAKVAPLSDAAHRLWFRVACWSCKPENLHTQGFIPETVLPSIAGRISKRKLKNLSKELVDANVGGTKQHGLWEPREGGFQIHDWHKYRPEDERLSPSEAASIAGKKSAEARKKKYGSAQPRASNDPEPFGNRSGDVRGDRSGSRSGDGSGPRSGDGSVEQNRTSRTPDPDPDPSKEDDEDPRLPGQGEEHPASGDEELPRRRPPRNREEALAIGIRERCIILLQRTNSPYLEWTYPHEWRELRNLSDAISKATGWHRPALTNFNSKPIEPLMKLLAEFSTEELRAWLNAIPNDPWYKGKGYTWLSDEVVRRTLDMAKDSGSDASENEKRAARREAEIEAEKEAARKRVLREQSS